MKKALLAACIGLATTAQADNMSDGVADIIITRTVLYVHRQGGLGPMSFESYEQVKPWSPLISYKSN